MAKQTINIGASPNDGTGTPLRTAFDYTNQNFTELYTATGPSGNNIVVPGSATITGDLTVDTNVLKVDSANDRVGIGTATPAAGYKLDVRGNVSGGNGTIFGGITFSSRSEIGSFTNHDCGFMANSVTQYLIGVGGNHTWYNSGSTAMTLNATGLGVGTSPTVKLDALTTVVGNSNALTIGNNEYGAATYLSSNSVSLTFNRGQTFKTAAIVSSNITNGNLSEGYIKFQTSASNVLTDRMLIDNLGNVGIGVAPSYKLQSVGIAAATSSTVNGSGGNLIGALLNSDDANSGVNPGVDLRRWTGTALNHGLTYIATNATGDTLFYNGTAASNTRATSLKMTLDASGNLLVGTTSALATGSTFQNLGTSRQVLSLKGDAFGSYTLGVWNASTTNDGLFQYFATETTLTVRGGISYNRGGGLVAYNTTSDYRAKDIIGPVSNSGSLIDSLKVYVGKMKGATIERPMLIAHEAQEVAPYAVTGTKDEVDADGNPKYQQMDVSALVPVLIAEIQSLRARVQTLEAK